VSREPIEERERGAWEAIDAAVAAAEERLGDRLASAYAIGSLAHGGFAPAVSDVDLALLTRERVAGMAEVVAEVRAEVARSHELGAKLSIFHVAWPDFADPPEGSRFPPIDRFDLVRYGVLVAGADLREEHATTPSAHEIRAQAIESALRRVSPEQLDADLIELRANGVTVHDATKAVLWPIRLQHVCDLGEATGNAHAVAHYLALPGAAHTDLARDALAWRDLASVPDPDAALARITAELCDLHVETFRRLAARADIPRRDELEARAAQLEASARATLRGDRR
jgi:predicted nucleotidyltransferase